MPFDGSGNFNRVMNWVSDATAGIKVVATRHDSEDDNLAAGLSNTLTKDGQSQPTANIPMNGKKLTNLATPTTGTDAATKAYVDAIRTFNTAITLSGANPQARIGFTVADIGFGAREAGTPVAGALNRFVWNDKPDFTGTDIVSIDDGGNMSMAGVNFMFNAQVVSGATFVAMTAGYAGWWQFNKANGVWTLYGTAASVASGAAAVPVSRLNVDTAGNLTTAAALIATTGNIQTVAGNVVSGGAVIAGSSVTANNGNFISGGVNAVVSNNGGSGAVYMRPNGAGSAVGQMLVTSAGDMTVNGNVTAGDSIAGNFVSSSVNAVLASTGAGAVFLRPNGKVSTVGQALVDSVGNLTITGNFVSNAAAATGVASGYTVNTSSGPAGLVKTSCNVSTTAIHRQFFNSNGLAGQISTNGSATTYATSSDERFKTFIGPYDPLAAVAIIRADPVRDFTWNVDGSYSVGWGAQTSFAVSPDLAVPPWNPDAQPGDEDFSPWGVDLGTRTPYLWAALSWALDKIDDLEARVAALEAA